VSVLTQSRGYTAAIVLLAIVAGAEGVLYIPLQGSYLSLQDDYSRLNNAYNTLQAEHGSLNADYTSVTDSYNDLQNDYDILEQYCNNLLEDYNSLYDDYDFLLEDYSVLSEDYEAEITLRIGNSLESYYDVVREKFGTWQSNTQMAQFAANLVSHSLGRIYWTSLENEFYQDVGEHSHDVAWAILNAALDLTGATTSQDPTERIAKILDLIDQYFHYEYDIEDVILAPAETLTFRSGDCDDFTMLAAALFEAVDIESAVAFFKHQDPGAEKKYHWMVLVHLDDLGEYGYWHYDDLTSMGLASGQWIIIEPQKTVDDQRSDWVGQWDLLAAAPLE